MQNTWRIGDRKYTLTETTFTKRQVLQWEFPEDKAISNTLFSRKRIENEYETLVYVAAKRTIPIPKPLGLSEENGSLRLTTRRIEGISLADIEDDKEQVAALSSVRRELYETIFPQLHFLHRNFVGSVSKALLVIPPLKLLEEENRTDWPSICSTELAFVLCHNDLGQHNIMVDRESHKIIGIMDWEYAMFGPEWVEEARWETKAQDRPFSRREEYVAKVKRFFEAK